MDGDPVKARVAGPELAHAVGWLLRASPLNRVFRPELAAVRIDADDDLTLVATDGDRAASITVEAQVGEPGATLVPSGSLAAVARVLPDRGVDVALSQSRLLLTAGADSFDTPTVELDGYPNVEPPTADGVDLAGGDLADVLAVVLPAASPDDQRPVLNGIHIVADGGRVAFEATDSYRMHRVTRPWDGPPFELLVPAPLLGEVLRSVAKARDTTCTVIPDGRRVVIRVAGDRWLAGGLIEGRFPSAAAVIPTGYTRRLVVAADPLQGALERAGVIADLTKMSNPPVRMHVTGDGIRITAGTGEAGTGDIDVDATVELDGDPISVGVSSRYLRAALTAADADQVALEFTDELKPMVVRPADAAADSPACVVMPIRV